MLSLRRALTILLSGTFTVSLCVASAAQDGVVHDPDPNNVFDRIAIAQHAVLAAGEPEIAGRGRFQVLDNGVTQAYPSGTVVISRAQIARYYQSRPDLTPIAIRLLLAHEYAHKKQFALYGPDILRTERDDALAYEAQADLMGAQWLQATLEPQNQLTANAVIGSMQVMFELGDPERSRNTGSPNDLIPHPEPQARRQSVRFGLALGHLALGLLLAADPHATPQQHNTLLAMVEPQIRELDLTGSIGDPWAWSRRQARKVVHWHAHAVPVAVQKDIAVSADGSRASYRIMYRNTGTDTLRLDISVQDVAYDSSIAHDGRRSELADSQAYTFTLPPGGSRTFQGSLARWNKSGWDDEVVAMPDLRALFASSE